MPLWLYIPFSKTISGSAVCGGHFRLFSLVFHSMTQSQFLTLPLFILEVFKMGHKLHRENIINVTGVLEENIRDGF